MYTKLIVLNLKVSSFRIQSKWNKYMTAMVNIPEEFIDRVEFFIHFASIIGE